MIRFLGQHHERGDAVGEEKCQPLEMKKAGRRNLTLCINEKTCMNDASITFRPIWQRSFCNIFHCLYDTMTAAPICHVFEETTSVTASHQHEITTKESEKPLHVINKKRNLLTICFILPFIRAFPS